jgi:hypothetical protein
MEQWEHGTLVITAGQGRPGCIEFLTASDEETVSHESAALGRQMNALNVLSEDGWELVGPPAIVQASDGMMKEYLLRRPKPRGGPQVH